MGTIGETHFNFKGQTGFHRGKVRDVYLFGDRVVIVVTDRISAFDTIFPRAIPDKGRILNQLALYNLCHTTDIIPNWVIANPDPNVTIGYTCNVFPIEVVVRGYLAGHAWRRYKEGHRTLCGVSLPEGLKENDLLPHPIITPSTKATTGHDQDITKKDILRLGLVDRLNYEAIEKYALALFQKGTEIADYRGLILVDTKYEFGQRNGIIHLVDEIHTPDSSRYFYKEKYHHNQVEGHPQRHLSKEFVRQWSIENEFQGKEGQRIPTMSDEDVRHIANRYKELYKTLTGSPLEVINYEDITNRIKKNVTAYLTQL